MIMAYSKSATYHGEEQVEMSTHHPAHQTSVLVCVDENLDILHAHGCETLEGSQEVLYIL